MDASPPPADMKASKSAKPVKISFEMLVKRNLINSPKTKETDEIIDQLSKVTHIRLDRENISNIDKMELLGLHVQYVYLQMNSIKTIENLECLQNLLFLTLSSNQISTISGLTNLKKLTFLDLSDNNISQIDTDELPKSLIILSVLENPCCNHPEYRKTLIKALPNLQQLDQQNISKAEKVELGLEVSSDEESEEGEPENEGTARADSFEGITTNILIRSQDRVETDLHQHKTKLKMLEEIRKLSTIHTTKSRSNSASNKPDKKLTAKRIALPIKM